MGNTDMDIFAPPVQQGLAVYSNHQNISNHPNANNYYADEYYANSQNDIVNGHPRFASPFPQADNYGMGSQALGNFSRGRNEGIDAFDLEDDQFHVPIPNVSPARSQGNQAQDLFLPHPHGYASDDDAEGDGDDEDDNDDKEGEDDDDDEEGDADADDDIYHGGKRNDHRDIEHDDNIESENSINFETNSDILSDVCS